MPSLDTSIDFDSISHRFSRFSPVISVDGSHSSTIDFKSSVLVVNFYNRVHHVFIKSSLVSLRVPQEAAGDLYAFTVFIEVRNTAVLLSVYLVNIFKCILRLSCDEKMDRCSRPGYICFICIVYFFLSIDYILYIFLFFPYTYQLTVGRHNEVA